MSHSTHSARRLRSALVACILLGPLGARAQTGAPYYLAPGDEITITVLRHAEFSGDYLIPGSGTIQIPAAGQLQVTDLTLDDVDRKVTDLMKVRLLHPEVTVKLKTARANHMQVVGAVKNSGTIDIKPGWGVLEALSAAGGLAPGVEQKDVRITLTPNDGRKQVQSTLSDALQLTGDKTIKVAPGDVLNFEGIGTYPIYITGKVVRPGSYTVREDSADLLAALAQAGGVAADASLSNVRIVHLDGTEETVDLAPALVRGESTKLPRLKPGDLVIVSESLVRYAVLGYVNKPGYYPLPQGRPLTLVDAVAQAQGPEKRARVSKIGVVRTEAGKQVQTIYDLDKYLHKGDASQNPTIRDGDVIYVPETNRADNSAIFSSLSSAAILFNVFRR